MISLYKIYKNTVLSERVVNLWDAHQKEKYAKIVWNMLQVAYKDIGGFKSAVNIDELIHDSLLWKLVMRNRKVTAVAIYKDRNGRKSIGAASDGTHEGKGDLYMIWLEDIRMNRSWSEVSGTVEQIMKMFDTPLIPSKYAADILGKHIISYDLDGYHYTRLIGGTPIEKILVGTVEGY